MGWSADQLRIIDFCSPDDARRVAILEGEAGSGKSSAMMHGAVCHSLQIPNGLDGNYLIGAWTTEVVQDVLIPTFERSCRMFGREPHREGSGNIYRAGRARFRIVGGSTIQARRRVLGGNYNLVALDEATEMPPEFVAEAIYRARIRQTGMPPPKAFMAMNAQSPGHPIKKNWIDRAAELGYLHLRLKAEDNPGLDVQAREELIRHFGHTAYGQRLAFGRWVEAEGVLFKSEWFRFTQRWTPGQCQNVIVAVDPAITTGEDSHYTGIAVMGEAGTDRPVFHTERVKLDMDQWLLRALKLMHQFDASQLVIEQNAVGDTAVTVLKRVCADMGIPVPSYDLITVREPKVERAKRTVGAWIERDLVLVGKKGTHADFREEALSFKEDGSHQSNDDIVDAVSLAYIKLRRSYASLKEQLAAWKL